MPDIEAEPGRLPTETLATQLLLQHADALRDLSASNRARAENVKSLTRRVDNLEVSHATLEARKMDRPEVFRVVKENFWKGVGTTLGIALLAKMGAIADKIAYLIEKFRG